MNRTTLSIRLAPWFFTLMLFAVWELSVRLFEIPTFLLPPPTLIAKTFVEFWPAIYRNSLITLEETVLGFALAQSDMRKRRVGEHAIGNEPIACASAPSGEVVADDAKVVFGYVREQRTAGAIAERPDVRSARLQPLVDLDETAISELDAG